MSDLILTPKDSGALIDLLRQRAKVGSSLLRKQSKWREEDRLLEERTKLDVTSSSAMMDGHINFFQDLEPVWCQIS